MNLILHPYRDAMQRTFVDSCGDLGLRLPRGLHGLIGEYGYECVERGLHLFDAVQVGFGRFNRGNLPRLDSASQLRRGQVDDISFGHLLLLS